MSEFEECLVDDSKDSLLTMLNDGGVALQFIEDSVTSDGFKFKWYEHPTNKSYHISSIGLIRDANTKAMLTDAELFRNIWMAVPMALTLYICKIDKYSCSSLVYHRYGHEFKHIKGYAHPVNRMYVYDGVARWIDGSKADAMWEYHPLINLDQVTATFYSLTWFAVYVSRIKQSINDLTVYDI